MRKTKTKVPGQSRKKYKKPASTSSVSQLTNLIQKQVGSLGETDQPGISPIPLKPTTTPSLVPGSLQPTNLDLITDPNDPRHPKHPHHPMNPNSPLNINNPGHPLNPMNTHHARHNPQKRG